MAYVIGVILALPVYGLVAVLAFMLVKLFLQWLIDDGSTPAHPGGRTPFRTKPKASLKG